MYGDGIFFLQFFEVSGGSLDFIWEVDFLKGLCLCAMIMRPLFSSRVLSSPSAMCTVYIENESYINIQCDEFSENNRLLCKFNFVSMNIKV